MDKTNFPKKSPRSSTKNERNVEPIEEEIHSPSGSPDFDLDKYLDRSIDIVARVRAAKERAQRAMEEFGDPSEYEVRIIRGKKKDAPEAESVTRQIVEPSQATLEFPAEFPAEPNADDSKENV